MKTPGSRAAHRTGSNDVGTLWTMRRLGFHARCALIALPSEWELRIVVDGEELLSERCPRGAEAFRLADQWRARMIQQGWTQVKPGRVTEPLHL